MRKHYVSTFRYLARIRSSVARSVRSIGVNYHFGVVVTLFILFSVCFSGVAQPTISYPVNSVDSLTRGMGSGKLAVNIGFTSACTSINVEIRLPGGVRYVPGTVTSTGGTGGLTIQDNGGPVNRPQFLISNAAAGNNIVFTIDRIANCGQGASGKDSVYVTSSCGNVSELGANVNTYNILSPSLVLSPPPAVANANIGSSYSRSFTVTNGGNGCLDTLRIGIKRPSGAIASAVLKIGATIIPVFSTNGDSTFYKVYGSNLPGGDNLMCNGETATLTEEFTLANCAGLTTTYLASWGRPGNSCQTTSGTGIVTMSAGVPNLAASFTATTMTNCGTVPRTYTLTITNNGTTPASNVNITFGDGQAIFIQSYSHYIDTTSIMVNTPSLAGYHPAAINVRERLLIEYSNNGVPFCAGGKIGMVDFNMPDGFTLGAGQSIVVTFNMQTCAGGGCNDNTDAGLITTGLTYKDQCGINNYRLPMGNVTTAPGPIVKIGSTSAQFPAQIAAGSCFTYKVDMQVFKSTNPATPYGYVQYAVNLPAGFTLNSAEETGSGLEPHSGYPKMVGNQAIFRHSIIHQTGGNSAHSVEFNVCVDANLCNTFAIEAVVTMSRDSTCSEPVVSKRCTSGSMEVYCAVPCVTGGVVPTEWAYYRTTYGLPDNNNDGIPEVSGSIDLTKIDRDRYRPGDVLHSVYRSYIINQTSPSEIDEWNYVYSDWTFGTGKWRPSGTATVTIKRGVTIYTLTGITIATVTANRAFKADWSTHLGLPGGFTYQPGDSVIVEADFMVDGDTQQAATYFNPGFTSDASGIIQLAQMVYTSQTANPPAGSGTGPDRFTCFIPKYNANVIGLQHFVLFDEINANGAVGCQNFEVAANIYTRKMSSYHGARYFPYEHRPETFPDTIAIDFPAGWDYISTVQSLLYVTRQPGSWSEVSLAISPTVSSYMGGIRLTYDFKTLLQTGIIANWGTEATRLRLSNRIRANCGTPATANATVTEYGHMADYPSAASPLRFVLSNYRAITYNLASRPVVAIQNNTGEVQGVLPQHYWDVQINSTGSTTAPFVWLALEQGASGIAIDSVVLKPSNLVLSATTYEATKKWYQVSAAGIASGSNQQARVYFKYNSCLADSIKILTGWSCSGFPAPDPTANSCNEIATYLKVLPQQSQIQVSVTKQPTSPSIGLCTSDYVEAVVNSALGANVDNPTVTIDLPAGMTINLPIEVEYPLGSGTWQNIAATATGNSYTINLEMHTGIGINGLPGTINYPGADGRQAKIRVSYNTSCSFISGSRIRFVTRGQSPCGGAVIGDGGYVNSNPISITNAIPDGTAALTMDIGNTQLTCDNPQNLLLSIIPVAESIVLGDTAVYTLPEGIAYSGSFVPGSNCTGCTLTQVAGPSGTTLLKVALPIGVLPGTSIAFSIGIRTSGVGNGCGDRSIQGELQRVVGGLSCGGTPCGASRAIIGSGSATVTILKPQLDAQLLSFTESGTTVNYSVNIVNNGTADAPAGYQLKIYCGPVEDNNVLKTVSMDALVKGNNQTYTGSLSSSPCSLGTELFAKVDTVFADNSPACSCSAPVVSPSRPLPVVLLDFKASKEDQAVSLSWTTTSETNSRYFDVEQSRNGKNWRKIGTVQAKGISSVNVLYTFTDSNPDNGENLYRLRMVDRDGKSGYSRIVSVRITIEEAVKLFPSPVSDKLTIKALNWDKVSDLEMYDSNGTVVYESHRGGAAKLLSNEINVKLFAPGVYMIRITSQNGLVTVHKVVVNR